MAMGRAITAADLIITAAGRIMAAAITGLSRVSRPRLLIAPDPGFGAIGDPRYIVEVAEPCEPRIQRTISFPRRVEFPTGF